MLKYRIYVLSIKVYMIGKGIKYCQMFLTYTPKNIYTETQNSLPYTFSFMKNEKLHKSVKLSPVPSLSKRGVPILILRKQV